MRQTTPAIGTAMFVITAFAFGLSFTYSAVQGEYGLFSRAKIESENRKLEQTLADVRSEVERMENLTLRLSDDYLDLDLLDEQVRSILGKLRADEIVIR